jgi:hypothetical protein
MQESFVMSRNFDSQVLVKTFLSAAHQAFALTSGKVVPTDDATHKTQNIIEYQGRMSVTGMDKFNGPTYIVGVSFFLNEQDRDKRRAKGAMVLYLEASNAEKILRGFGHPISDDDEDEETFTAYGKVCTTLADKFKESLAQSGYPSLVLSEPVSSKNSLSEGIDFSSDQTQKQEISFYFWKKKALVVDLTMADLSRR